MLRTRIATMSLVLAASAAPAPAPAQQYVISTFAGGGPLPARAQAMDASIGSVLGIAMDTAGNVYFSSSEFNAIFKLDPGGVLTRFAGNGRAGYRRWRTRRERATERPARRGRGRRRQPVHCRLQEHEIAK